MNKFAHHKKALYNFAFWTTITEGSQTITNYDRLLCEKGPISKQTSHDYFFRDIRYITAHFQEDREFIQHIKKLSKSVDNVKNDADNKHFWANIAPRLMAIHYEKPVAEDELKLAGMRKVADLLNKEQTKKRSNSSALETRNTKHRKDNEDKELKRIEHDGVFLTSSSISVGTTIKRKALELFREKQLNKMTPRERKLVTNGLSSILDLTDDSNLSQRSLFSKDEWNELKEKFGSELLPELEAAPITLTNTWKIISSTVVTSGDLDLGLDYIHKIYMKIDRRLIVYLDLFRHILNLLINYPEYVCKDLEDDHSESDLLRIVWSPILEFIFPKKNYVKVKTGETINAISQQQKKDLYCEEDSVKAFKIDIRVIHNTNGAEVDIVAGEIAIDDEDTKLVSDEGKLCRETKDAVDAMISITGNPVQAIGLQINGSTCLVTLNTLARNGLYVYLPYFTFSLPTCIRDLNSFSNTFQQLFTLEKLVLQTSQLLQHHLKEKQSFDSLGRHREDDLSDSILNWRRETFYTPPNKNCKAKVPAYIFGTPSSEFVSKLLSAKYSEGEAVSYDAYGWGKWGNKWHNKITNDVLEESPYDD